MLRHDGAGHLTTVDIEVGAGAVTRLVAGEKQSRIGNLARCTHAAQHHVFRLQRFPLLVRPSMSFAFCLAYWGLPVQQQIFREVERSTKPTTRIKVMHEVGTHTHTYIHTTYIYIHVYLNRACANAVASNLILCQVKGTVARKLHNGTLGRCVCCTVGLGFEAADTALENDASASSSLN